MSNYDNSNTGSLSRNDKGDNEKRPDLKGSLKDVHVTCGHCGKVSIVGFWLSAWQRVAKTGANEGKKFLSLTCSQMEPKSNESAPAKAPQKKATVEDDDIPF